MKKYAALYARVSTEAQREEGYSIDAQKELLEAFCVSKEIKDYRFYVDGGFSGSNLERPELKRMVEDVKAGKISLVAVYKLDRLSRSQKDTLYLIEDVLNPHNTDFVSLNENMDTSTPIGRAMLGIISAFAQLERETIKMRTRLGMKERVKTGLWMGGGRIPFGYDYDKEKGILVPNADADTVRKIYDMYLQGYSPNYIARALDIQYERLVLQVLKRKSNAGYIIYNGEEYKGQHQPIISEEIFEQAQDRMRLRAQKRIHSSDFLLTGLVYCGQCGAKMRYQKWGDKGYRLSCYSQQKSKPYLVRDPACGNVKPWANDIEDALIRDLLRLSVTVREKKGKETDILSALQEKMEKQQAKQKKLYHLYAESDDDMLYAAIAETQKETERLRTVIEKELKTARTARETALLKKKIEKLSEVWEYMTSFEKQQFVRSCVDKITVDGERVCIYYVFDS